jgi:hypothetical protein
MKGILSLVDGQLGQLDRWYFAYHCLRNRHAPAMFHQGWGSQEAIDALNASWASPRPASLPVIKWDDEWLASGQGFAVRNGRFRTPADTKYLPHESHTAYFRFVQPHGVESHDVVLLTPASREAGVEARMPIARDLAMKGISTVLLESPFMGRRQSPRQIGTMLSHFSDFLVLSAASIEEARSLTAWLCRQPFSSVCVAGISKGGDLATVAGLRSPENVKVVSIVGPHSGVPVLLEGLLGTLCDWDLLQRSSGSSKPVRQHVAEVFEQTSLERLPLPGPGKRLITIGARNDRYVPASSLTRMQTHWGPHADVRWLPGGHVSSIAERGHLVNTIVEALTPRRL